MAVKKAYKFAALKTEANRGKPKIPPFVLDDVVPKVVIKPPQSLETSLALAELGVLEGQVKASNVREAFAIICGDAFPQVWNLIKDERLEVAGALLGAIMEHFETNDDGTDDVPGGSDAS